MVDWALATQIARFAAGGGGAPIEADFPALVAENERHLRDYTKLELTEPIPPPEPVDRAAWAEVNINSMARLLEPVNERLSKRFASAGPLAGPLRIVVGATVAAECGLVVGHMSQRVLGQYEGYSEHVMDVLGERVLPAYQGLRDAMERRRRSRSYPERILQRLLGLDLKMRQYELGKRFCDAVVAEAGIEALNRVWESPEALPTLRELEHPSDWL